MTSSEVNAALKQINEKLQTSWEQTRVLTTHFVNCFQEKAIPATELMPFSWDNLEVKKVIRTCPTPEKIKAMEDLINNLNNEQKS